jgi:hypothetical protein
VEHSSLLSSQATTSQDIKILKITATSQFKWLKRMMRDHELSHMAFRVGSAIGTFFNGETGTTFVGRGTIAKMIGVSVKSVDRAIGQLELRGHLKVRHARGRGNVNVYGPAGEDAVPSVRAPGINAVKIDADASILSTIEKAPIEEKKDDKFDPKRGQRCPPNYQGLTTELNKEESSARAREVFASSSSSPARPALANTAEGSPGPATSHKQHLIDRLTERHRVDGNDVLVNLSGEFAGELLRKIAEGRLTSKDVADARHEYERQRDAGIAIETLEGKERFWAGLQPMAPRAFKYAGGGR